MNNIIFYIFKIEILIIYILLMDIHQLRLLLPNYIIKQDKFICIKTYDHIYCFINIEKLTYIIDHIKNIHDTRKTLCDFLELNNFIKMDQNYYIIHIGHDIISVRISIYGYEMKIYNDTKYVLYLLDLNAIFAYLKKILNTDLHNKLVNE